MFFSFQIYFGERVVAVADAFVAAVAVSSCTRRRIVTVLLQRCHWLVTVRYIENAISIPVMLFNFFSLPCSLGLRLLLICVAAIVSYFTSAIILAGLLLAVRLNSILFYWLVRLFVVRSKKLMLFVGSWLCSQSWSSPVVVVLAWCE